MSLLHRLAVERDQFVADAEGKLRDRQQRAVDGVDQHLAVVDVDGHRQRG